MIKHATRFAASLATVALAAALLAGCGAGSYGASSGVYQGPGSGNTPPPNPQGVPLNTATLKGAAGFVNGSGFTVYVFDADLQAPGSSTCNGDCAANWPPLIAPAGTLPSPYSTIARQDGHTQLAYKGRPLYTFVGDSAPGMTNGDGLNVFGGVWHIARP